jgi:hypothetical protein
MLEALKQKLAGLASSVVRFPATAVFLLASFVLTAAAIGGEDGLIRHILACLVGAAGCAAGQTLNERFFSGVLPRVGMYAAGVAAAGLFYLSVRSLPPSGPEMTTRFAVALFALLFAFIWFGVARTREFGGSFMAAFKALFEAAFFSGVLFLGCVLIIAAVDRLIAPVDEDANLHTANVVFTLAAPVIFLSLIPVYPGRARGELSPERRAVLDRRTSCPKFLEVLLSYILIPLTGIFSLILLVYILLNIGGEFWTNNLLEPMLVAYTIAVTVLTLLVGRLKNKTAVLFVRIFPKVMIPIALFQLAASSLLLRQTGLTFGRYYVLLYGAFAVFAGVALSLGPRVRSGVIAPVLIALSILSLVPPVDAFTVSRASQLAALESTLENNGMLAGGAVTPNGGIPEAEKTKIIASVRYLSDMGELGTVGWLPEGFDLYDDAAFLSTFGFHLYNSTQPGYQYVSVYYDRTEAIPIAGFDVLAQIYIPNPGKPGFEETSFVFGGKRYTLTADGGLAVKDERGAELLRFDTGVIIDRYASYPADKRELTLEERRSERQTSGLRSGLSS